MNALYRPGWMEFLVYFQLFYLCQLGQRILTGLSVSVSQSVKPVAQRCWSQSVSPPAWSSLSQGILDKYIQHPRHLASWPNILFSSVLTFILIKIHKLELQSISSVIFILWEDLPCCSTPACLSHFSLRRISILGTFIQTPPYQP